VKSVMRTGILSILILMLLVISTRSEEADLYLFCYL
jgi:hypothetical protein